MSKKSGVSCLVFQRVNKTYIKKAIDTMLYYKEGFPTKKKELVFNLRTLSLVFLRVKDTMVCKKVNDARLGYKEGQE